MVLFTIFLLNHGRIQGWGGKGETDSPQIYGGKCPHRPPRQKGEKKGKKREKKMKEKKEKRG